MSDVSNQEDESTVGEPLQQVDGSPASPSRLHAVHWLKELWSPGLVALAEVAALLGLFWFVPWFSWHGVNIGLGLIDTPAADHALNTLFSLHSYSGWTMAQGIAIPEEPAPFLVYLWLIPLISVALASLAGLHLQHLLSTHVAFVTFLTLSGLALLIEGGLYFQTRQFQQPLDGGGYHASIAAGVSWGFWVAVGVNAAALVAGVALPRTNQPAHETLDTRSSLDVSPA
jgi:hypothetical protein